MARRGETVILAAGDFPRKGTEARMLLDGAKRVVCCDGAAASYMRRTGRTPDVIVGDMDSFPPGADAGTAEVVRIAEQDTNDLAKAVRVCRARGWDSPVILGATGGRDDHAIGNVFRALDFGLEVVTDSGRFVPVEGEASILVGCGTPVSVFATDPSTRMTSRGLAWPLDGVAFANLYCATLNRASEDWVRLTSTRRVYVFIAGPL